MSSIYSIDTQKNLILYSCGQYIYLRISTGESIDRPIILSSDFNSHLFDTIYNNTVHYSYVNTGNDIIIKSILDTNILYKLSINDSPDCTNAGLTVFNEELIMVYLVKNPLDDTFVLKCIAPFNPEHSITLPDTFTKIPTIKLFANNDNLYIIVVSDCTNIWGIDINLTLHRYSKPLDPTSIEEKISSRYTDELKRKNAIILQQNDIIESIKLQYNELMDTATKYRDEAIKWRSKFHQ